MSIAALVFVYRHPPIPHFGVAHVCISRQARPGVAAPLPATWDCADGRGVPFLRVPIVAMQIAFLRATRVQSPTLTCEHKLAHVYLCIIP